MQIQKTTLDGLSSGIDEMAVLTNSEYINAAIAASQDESGFHVVIGENLLANQNKGDIAAQIFHVIASNGVLIATNLVP